MNSRSRRKGSWVISPSINIVGSMDCKLPSCWQHGLLEVHGLRTAVLLAEGAEPQSSNKRTKAECFSMGPSVQAKCAQMQ
eukprot:1161666-Pelagomonas_calceolata.AAC.1